MSKTTGESESLHFSGTQKAPFHSLIALWSFLHQFFWQAIFVIHVLQGLHDGRTRRTEERRDNAVIKAPLTTADATLVNV